MPRFLRQFGLRTLLILFVVLAVGLGLLRWHMVHAEYLFSISQQIDHQHGKVHWKLSGPSGLGKYSFREAERVVWEAAEVDDKDIQILRKLPELEEVRLSGNPLTDEGMAVLKDLPRIRKLTLFDTEITDRGLEYVGLLKELEELDIRHTNITEEGLAHLRGLKHLKQLQFDITLTDVGVDHLATMPSLQLDKLVGNGLTETGTQQVSQLSVKWLILGRPQGSLWADPLADYSRLEQLEVTDGVMQSTQLQELLQSKTLKRLTLTRVAAGDLGLIDSSEVASMKEIKLIETDITPAGLFARYGHVVRMIEIHESVDDGNAEMSLDGIPGSLYRITWRGKPTEMDWNGLKNCRAVGSLEINWSQPIDDFAASVRPMQQLSSFLVTFSIDDNVLRSLSRLPRINKLLLYGQQQITPDGLGRFADGKDLGAVVLESANITDAHLAALSKAANVQRLRIADNPITDEGLRFLTLWEGIVYLDISNCSQLTDEALRHVGQMKEMIALHAEGLPITDRGLQYLHGMPALALVGLEGANVSSNAIRALQQASPRAGGVKVKEP